MPRKHLTAVLLLGAVLGALVAATDATAAPPDPRPSANRGWDAPPPEVFALLD